MNSSKHLYLVDASSVFFRAYYAIPFMQTDFKGKPLQTNALYGYMTTTLKVLDKFKPQYLVYCFDRPEPSYRVDDYKDYKANREEMPEDLEEQMPYIQQATDLLGIPRIDKPRYEADDLIGSLAVWVQKKGIHATIISSDKDFAQLVSPEIHLYDPIKEIFYNTEKVQSKWGVLPSQIVDYLAIVGDASDNIPGVRGIGPKGAQTLLAEYGKLTQIYKNINKVHPRWMEKLKVSKESAFISQKLARIVTNLKLMSKIDEAQKSDFKTKELKIFLEQMQFRSIQKKLFSEKHSKEIQNKKSSELLKKSNSVLKKLKKQTVSLKNLSENLKPYEEVCVFLWEDKAQVYFKKNWLELSSVSFEKLGSILSYKKVKWWGYDLKSIWKKCHAKKPLALWDLMISAHLVDGEPSKSFAYLCENCLGVSFSEEDSIKYLIELRDIFQKKMEDMNLQKIFSEIEMPLISVLYRMEQKGVLLDMERLKTEKKELNCQILDLEDKIFALAGHPFNVSSPQQLNSVLFDELKLKRGRKIKTGYSTDVHVLQELKHHHPIIPLILNHRELFKLKTTYVEGLLNEVDKETGRIHTSFKQTMTATGRLSSVQPNLQNIPIRTERGRQIRRAFIAQKDKVLICADYSQIELRILAHLSQDPGLVEAFLRDEDIHQATAVEIFGVAKDKVSAEQRRRAKAVNFGITYGQTAFGLSQALGVTPAEGQDIVNRYFSNFPKVKSYISKTLKEVEQKGYVETLFGRRRRVREILSKNKNIKKHGERIAFNTRIQGSASDIVKKAMIQLSESLWSDILVQVHDELLFECFQEDVESEVSQIRNIMEQAVSLSVPLKVHIGKAQDWNQAQVK